MTWFADTASWALIAGVLTPILVSLVQQPRWSEGLRAIVALAVAVVVGVLTVLANGGFADASGSLGVIALVLVASNTAYKTFWKPTGVSPAIEAKTSPGNQPVAGRRRNQMGQTGGWIGPAIGLVVLLIFIVLLVRIV
jgi:hypothetical protein